MNMLLFLNGFSMFSYVNSCLKKNLIKLGGVLSCVMAFNIVLFHNCNRILADNTGYVGQQDIYSTIHC